MIWSLQFKERLNLASLDCIAPSSQVKNPMTEATLSIESLDVRITEFLDT